MAVVYAPFTPQQVTALDRWQNAMPVHPFTCGNDHPEPRNLIPTRDGWVCSVCAYTQNWAHDFMLASADRSPQGGNHEDGCHAKHESAVAKPDAQRIPTSPPIGTDEELIAKLRAKIVLQRGEVISIDLLDGKGPRPVTTGETVRLINPDGPEAADALQSRISEVERLNAECERAWESQKIAFEQAMANGEALSHARAEIEKLKAALSQHRTTG